VLWSPSNFIMFLSPAYFSNICYEWCGWINSSCSPVANNAGMKHSCTWSIGFNLYMSKFARLSTDFLISAIAVLTKKLGSFVCVRANSVTSYFMSANALSKTIPAILGSRSPCNKAVAAPIERPHKPTVFTFLSLLRWFTITLTSSLSCQPSDMNSPSDLPHPGKSKQNRVIFAYKTKGTSSTASKRQELFPCRYTIQGISSHYLTSSAGSKW
jgi:hypothetical protein